MVHVCTACLHDDVVTVHDTSYFFVLRRSLLQAWLSASDIFTYFPNSAGLCTKWGYNLHISSFSSISSIMGSPGLSPYPLVVHRIIMSSPKKDSFAKIHAIVPISCRNIVLHNVCSCSQHTFING